MDEQPKKRRLIEIREEDHFDIPKTARLAALPPMIVWQMINYQPVKKEYAKAVLQVLSTPERPLSLENVDITLEKEESPGTTEWAGDL